MIVKVNKLINIINKSFAKCDIQNDIFVNIADCRRENKEKCCLILVLENCFEEYFPLFLNLKNRQALRILFFPIRMHSS